MAKLAHGPRIEIPMASEDLERQIFSQNTIKMFEMPPLENWMIFALDQDKNLVQNFIRTLKDSVTTFNIFTREPKVVLIKSRSYAEWDEVIREQLTPKCIAAILIIPGRKGFGNHLYEDLKKLLIQDIPVPSQMILAQTIDRAKNALYSVTNRTML